MESRSEIVKKFKKLRKEADEHQDTACRLQQEIEDTVKEVSEQIIEYYLKNGGLDGRYFKSPSYDQCVYTDDPAGAKDRSVHGIYIKRLISIAKGHVTFYGQDFPLLSNGRYSEYSSIGLEVQTTAITALHPDYEIDKIDFANALAEWKKRSDKFVEDLIDNPKKGNLTLYCNYEQD